MNSTMKCATLNFSHYTKVTFWLKFAVIATSTINAVTSVSATFGNFLIIYIIFKNTRLRNPSNLLLGSLSVTDFLVGLIVQPLFVIRKVLEIHTIHSCTILLMFRYSTILCGVASFLNIALISIDRCFAVISL